MGLLDRCAALALALTLTLGCGSPTKRAEIDPALQPYVDEFSRQFGMTVDWIPTKFKVLEGNWVGVCEYSGEGEDFKAIAINIDPDYWEDADEGERESLIMHEFGHCVLQRDHDDAWITMGGQRIPRSVMNSYVFSGSLYLAFKDYYMKELFRR